TAPVELVDYRLVERGLDEHVGSIAEAKPRRIACRLRVRPMVEHPHDQLHLSLRLQRGADDAEAQPGPAIPRDESGNDGMEWTLAPADLVDVTPLEAERGAPRLHADACARHDDAGRKIV